MLGTSQRILEQLHFKRLGMLIALRINAITLGYIIFFTISDHLFKFFSHNHQYKVTHRKQKVRFFTIHAQI